MNVVIIGAGYVGLTTGVVLAYLGHKVVAVEKDQDRLDRLLQGVSPIREPGIEELMAGARHNLCFASEPKAVGDADLVMIAVGTPSKRNGEADIRYVEDAAMEASANVRPGRAYVFVIKSTVPIGTNRRLSNLIGQTLNREGVEARVIVASNPEFLREGMAVRDTLYPDRVVVGTDDAVAIDILRRLYRPILEQTFEPPAGFPRPDGYTLPPLISTDPISAEMIKYAANAFLAVKISFINEISGLCDKVGADVAEVARGIGLDPRIGARFLAAGLGWGGSCLPKDTAALIAMGGEYGYSMPIVQAAREVNSRQRHLIVEKLQSQLKVLRGSIVGVLGLTFKPNTDDIRESPALELVRLLHERGAHVRVHDPVALPAARKSLVGLDVDLYDDPYKVADGADAVVLATEWEMYRELDLKEIARRMHTPILVDGRNFYRPEEAKAAGFRYLGVGR